MGSADREYHMCLLESAHLQLSAGCTVQAHQLSGYGLRSGSGMRTLWMSVETYATAKMHSVQVPSANDGSDAVPRRKTAMAAAHDSITSPLWNCRSQRIE